MKKPAIFALALSLAAPLAYGPPPKEDPNKVADIDGVHYTGVAWGPRRGNEIMMFHNGGTMNVPLEKVPPRVLQSYGVNPAAVAAQMRAAAQAASDNADAAATRGYYCIDGKVLQKLGCGMLVNSGVDMRRDVERQAAAMMPAGALVSEKYFVPLKKDGRVVYEGLCLLKGHPREASLVDEDTISVGAILDGIYTYNTVGGGTKTVRSFWTEGQPRPALPLVPPVPGIPLSPAPTVAPPPVFPEIPSAPGSPAPALAR